MRSNQSVVDREKKKVPPIMRQQQEGARLKKEDLSSGRDPFTRGNGEGGTTTKKQKGVGNP